jgi:hypothetical protein
MYESQPRPAAENPAPMSFYTLFDQYIAVQSLLTVRMAEINYQQVAQAMRGGAVNYYNKRAGLGELSSAEMLVLANMLEMQPALLVIQELIDNRQRLYGLLKATPASLIRVAVPDQSTAQRIIKLRSKSPDRWKNHDLLLLLDTLKAIDESIRDLLTKRERPGSAL